MHVAPPLRRPDEIPHPPIIISDGDNHDGANFVVRGGAYEVMEGNERERNFVIEFRDRATAMACYQCPEYQAAVKIRQKYSDADLIIIDGPAS
jgi:uncharacterized protein (DUF1330 family)